MDKEIKIICTIGPTSKNAGIIHKFETRNVSLIRMNLSHIDENEVEEYLLSLRKFNIPIAIDTEGAQIRTGNLDTAKIDFAVDDIVRLHRRKIKCDKNNLYFTPHNTIDHILPGSLIAIDFNSLLLRVEDVADLKRGKYIVSRVIIPGSIGSNKGVHCEDLGCKLPYLSPKDLKAVKLAKQYGIKHFTLSFVNNKDEVKEFKRLYPGSIVYAKIETLNGVENVHSILNFSDGILIDRGDLSREIPIQKIPLTQKFLIKTANLRNKEVFVASNLLESMADYLKPSRAEVNDIINTIFDGVSGFVLTKETAVGKYPVETVNMLNSLIYHSKIGLIKSKKGEKYYTTSLNLALLKNNDYFTNKDVQGSLIQPHGGRLIERFLNADREGTRLDNIYKIEVDQNALMDMEQIAIGTYSPLQGFMCRGDFKSVLDRMRLTDGTIWTIPIVLTIDKYQAGKLKDKKKAAIVSRSDKKIYGMINIDDIYTYDKQEFAKKLYGTTDTSHPGVSAIYDRGDYIVGGRVDLLRRINSKFMQYNLTPRQIRSLFEALGWNKVVGFHTRNAIHRSHEYIQLDALSRTGCDGLFVQPLIGEKKKGDFTTEAIIRSYELMLEKFYPKNKVIFGLFSTYSRYAGPREAVFTALCRQNFGCSHFIVGRDHTGVHNFFGPKDSHRIFSEFNDLCIEPVFFEEMGYSKSCKHYVSKKEVGSADFIGISGTEIRNKLKNKKMPEDWIMRSEISKAIIDISLKGQKILI